MDSIEVFSIGHSTHSLDEFVSLLRANSIEAIADIRTVPKSRRHPHFHTDSLTSTLPEKDLTYRHLPRLGGWRKADPDSVNSGWKNESFRGYADYTMTEEFVHGLDELIEMASREKTAMMCSEALWWRCHRRLVADRLINRGVPVLHIGSDGRTSVHELTGFAVIDPKDGSIRYPPPPG